MYVKCVHLNFEYEAKRRLLFHFDALIYNILFALFDAVFR